MHARRVFFMTLATTTGTCISHTDSLSNWSGNHSCTRAMIARCDTDAQVLKALASKARMMGSGLSPNGMAFDDGHEQQRLISIESMKGLVSISQDETEATFKAGTIIGDVVEELRAHGLMLENLASINDQQLGGFYQVGAHGTGPRIPPVEEQIESMTIVTPGKGVLKLSRGQPLFDMCKLGLGCLGVVTQVTMRVKKLHNLKERVTIMTRQQVKERHRDMIANNKHIKYMWLPYVNRVVVTSGNDTDERETDEDESGTTNTKYQHAMEAMHRLFAETFPDVDIPKQLNFADFRSTLLRGANEDGVDRNLSPGHVRRVNKAEAKFHERMQAQVVKRADKMMAFDCGGPQLVMEVAVKCGDDADNADSRDVDFVLDLLETIETEGLPAPCPIEHRWTSGSTAPMSPAYGAGLHGWIGVVMYLPSTDPSEVRRTTEAFRTYCQALNHVAKKRNLKPRCHWAKVEIPETEADLVLLRKELSELYPLKEFDRVRKVLDPHDVLGNAWVDALLKP